MPIDYVCPATTDRMTRCFQDRVFKERLEGLAKDTSIAIVTEIRNNETFKKDTIIKLLDPLIPKDKFRQVHHIPIIQFSHETYVCIE